MGVKNFPFHFPRKKLLPNLLCQLNRLEDTVTAQHITPHMIQVVGVSIHFLVLSCILVSFSYDPLFDASSSAMFIKWTYLLSAPKKFCASWFSMLTGIKLIIRSVTVSHLVFRSCPLKAEIQCQQKFKGINQTPLAFSLHKVKLK